ncbi:MAG: YadA-like family protein, partial [Prochlorococcus sp.]
TNSSASDASSAFGYEAKATGPFSLALGFQSSANADSAIAVGRMSSAISNYSLALGEASYAGRTESAALGNRAVANSAQATALGARANASHQGSTAIGTRANTTRNDQLMLGTRQTQTTVANLAGNGSAVIIANSDGTLLRHTSFASGDGATALGANSSASGAGATVFGSNSTSNGTNALAMGPAAIANGVGVIAIGAGASATGFHTDGIAIGTSSVADGTDVTALGAGATATGERATALGSDATASFKGSTAVGAGSITTRANQVVVGTFSTHVTMPSLSGSGTAMIGANSDGTLQRSSVSMNQVETVVLKKVPKLESAARGLGQAVESSGAIASAMSAIPEVSLQEDEPVRCGVGTGGYGSQYAFSAGCAVRVGDRLHLNGALAYTPSVDYEYGSTPTVAGRLGFSFPLGRVNKASNKSSTKAEVTKEDIFEYRSAVNINIAALQDDLKSRDQQIDKLKSQLEMVLDAQSRNGATNFTGGEATNDLIALLQARISKLEDEKRRSAAENTKQDQTIAQQGEKLAKQDQKIETLEDKIAEQQEEMDEQKSIFQRVIKQLKVMMPGKGGFDLGHTSQDGS